MTVIAPDIPTHYPANRRTPTYIDLLVVKNINELLNPISLPVLCSDHNPVSFSLQNNLSNYVQKTIYDYKRCNWRRFRQILNDEWTMNNQIETRTDIDNTVTKLTDLLKQTLDKTTKTIKIKSREVVIPLDILNLIKFKNKIRDRLDQNRKKIWNNKIQKISHRYNSV